MKCQFMDMRLPVANEVERFKAAVNITPLWDDDGEVSQSIMIINLVPR